MRGCRFQCDALKAALANADAVSHAVNDFAVSRSITVLRKYP